MVTVEQVAWRRALLSSGLESGAVARQADEERDVGVLRARVDLGCRRESGAQTLRRSVVR